MCVHRDEYVYISKDNILASVGALLRACDLAAVRSSLLAHRSHPFLSQREIKELRPTVETLAVLLPPAPPSLSRLFRAPMLSVLLL